jgi:SagB-type dehydrogenase family enzyme
MQQAAPTEELRPIAQQVPRQRDGALVFEVGANEVRVEGDPALALRALAACDGFSTVTEIAGRFDGAEADEVRGLLDGLIEAEVLVHYKHAWRHLHRISSVTHGLHEPLPDPELMALMSERFAPQRLAERAEALRPKQTAVWELTGRRSSSTSSGGERPVTFEELSNVLGSIYGRAESGHHPIPSAGAIYPLVIHALLRRPLDPLEAGLWWYDPERFELRLVREDELDVTPQFIPHPETDPLLAHGHPIVFISADLERPSRKYSNRGYRYALMEIGAAAQSVYLAASELELPVRAIGGVIEDPLHEFLELPVDCDPLLALLLGS